MLRELRIGDMVAKLPIIQGGMGVGVSLSRLAGAVAKEGFPPRRLALRSRSLKRTRQRLI